ncbi:MAG: hypothetical protein QY328_06575 [Anaerolineales bacterium]|nr:hypothetical protein [Anaerolineales bacterium]WKZ41700.1 MAG: hypothetical protein QY328_06575 [Anaerolineales bacterium]
MFPLLRRYFKDEEFEETKTQLAESKALLAEYKGFILKEKGAGHSENNIDKVEPDFLVIIWASIGLALSIGVEAVKNLSNPISTSFSITEITWAVIALYTVFYIIMNGLFAMNLTLDYAKSKLNNGYKTFAYTLIAGIALVFIGLMIIAQVGSN